MRNACLHNAYYKFTSYYCIFKFENEWNIGKSACINILYTYTIIHIYCVYHLYTVKKIRHNILYNIPYVYVYIYNMHHKSSQAFMFDIHPSLSTHTPHKRLALPSQSLLWHAQHLGAVETHGVFSCYVQEQSWEKPSSAEDGSRMGAHICMFGHLHDCLICACLMSMKNAEIMGLSQLHNSCN